MKQEELINAPITIKPGMKEIMAKIAKKSSVSILDDIKRLMLYIRRLNDSSFDPDVASVSVFQGNPLGTKLFKSRPTPFRKASRNDFRFRFSVSFKIDYHWSSLLTIDYYWSLSRSFEA